MVGTYGGRRKTPTVPVSDLGTHPRGVPVTESHTGPESSSQTLKTSDPFPTRSGTTGDGRTGHGNGRTGCVVDGVGKGGRDVSDPSRGPRVVGGAGQLPDPGGGGRQGWTKGLDVPIETLEGDFLSEEEKPTQPKEEEGEEVEGWEAREVPDVEVPVTW